MGRIGWGLAGTLFTATAALLAASCGDDDGEPRATAFGNVSVLNGQQVSSVARPPSFLARVLGPAEAIAQGSGVTGFLACVITFPANDADAPTTTCERLEANGSFTTSFEVDRNRQPATLVFVDDENGNGIFDDGEPSSELAAPPFPRVCKQDNVRVRNASVNTGSGTTFADEVVKTHDSCPTSSGGSGSPTPVPTGSGTPGPQPTNTPAYYAAATSPMTSSPSGMLALLVTLGAVGLLLPRRRD